MRRPRIRTGQVKREKRGKDSSVRTERHLSSEVKRVEEWMCAVVERQ